MLGRLLVIGIISCTVWINAATAGQLFRYKNAEGQVVIKDSLSKEAIQYGYEVLNDTGQVLEVVPRRLTEAERQALSDKEAEQRNAEEERQRQLEWDESLLRRYSEIADIEAARNRAVKELEIRVSILRGNMLALKRKVEAEQARAADIERRGRKVPESIMENLKVTREELESTEKSIDIRQVEIDAVRQSYQRDIDRFRYITEELGYRRR